MADLKNLKERTAKAEEKVAKCEGTIERHKKALTKKLANVAKHGVTLENLEEMREKYRGTDISWELYEVEHKLSDIEGAKKKLREAETILENWKTKLSTELEKERFLEGNAPAVIREFLETWKASVYKWHVNRYEKYIEAKEALKEEVAEAKAKLGFTDSYYHNRSLYEKLVEMELDEKSVKNKLAKVAGSSLVLELASIRKVEERWERLEKVLEEEKKSKMLYLIYRVNEIVGTITDASHLLIRAGNLNGYIIGEKGKAKVETIGAGGYNIQCFHYRTLVNRIK